MTEFSKKVVEVIKRIPEGSVASYGQIAAMAGNPKGARAVVYILRARGEEEKLPWHRILGKSGDIRIKHNEWAMIQKDLLECEGVIVSDTGKVNMQVYGWKG